MGIARERWERYIGPCHFLRANTEDKGGGHKCNVVGKQHEGMLFWSRRQTPEHVAELPQYAMVMPSMG